MGAIDGLKQEAGAGLSLVWDDLTAKSYNAVADMGEKIGGTLKSAIEDPIGTLKGTLTGALDEMGPFGVGLAAMGGAAALAGTKIFEMAEGAAAVAESIEVASITLGMSVDETQRLKSIVDLAGSSLQDMTRYSWLLQRQINSTGEQQEKFQSGLEALGINVEHFKSLNFTDQLLEVSAGMNKGADGMTNMQAAMAIFGSRGRSILPLISKDLADIADQAKDVELGLSEGDVKAGEKFEIQVKKMHMEWENLSTHIGTVFIPALTISMDILNKMFNIFTNPTKPGVFGSYVMGGYMAGPAPPTKNVGPEEPAAGPTVKTESDKIIAATQKLWDDYNAIVAKSTGTAKDVAIANANTWYNTHYAQIEAAAKKDVNAWTELDALNAGYYARLEIADTGSAKSRATTADKLQKEQNKAATEWLQQEDSIAKLGTSLWDTYYQNVAKGDKDAVAVALATDKKWYDSQYESIAKLAEKNKDAWDLLGALDSAYYAKMVTDTGTALDKESAEYERYFKQLNDSYEQRAHADNKMTATVAENARQQSNVIGTGMLANIKVQNDAYAKMDKTVVDSTQRQYLAVSDWVEQERAKIDYHTEGWETSWNAIDTAADSAYHGITVKSKEATNALGDLANAFVRIGQAAGGSMGGILGKFGQMVTMADSAVKSTQVLGADKTNAIGGNFGYGSVLMSGNATGGQKLAAGGAIVANTMQGVSDMQTAFDQKSTGARLMGSTMAGAKIGSAFGPYGMAVGAAAGFVAGLIKGKPDWAKAQDEMAKGYGVAVSDELSHAIADTAKTEFKGDRNTAALSHLSDIIKDVGGLTSTNLPLLEARFHDVFSAIQTGQMSVAQGTKVIDENFQQFATAGTDAYGVLDKNLRGIISLNDEFGTKSKAVLDYVGSQGSIVAQTLGDSLTIGAQAIKDGNTGLVDAVTIQTQASADAMAYAVSASFDAMIASGMNYSDAVKAIQPAIDGLATQMAAAGLTGSQAFIDMQAEVALYSDAVAGPALESVDSLSRGLVSLGNMGKDNQDTFMALSSQIGQTFDSLVAQGKDGHAVMNDMRDSLQRVWEEQQTMGYKTDEATQKLLDQAVAEGIVGEAHKSATDQMLDATKHMADSLDRVAVALGATIPNAAADGAKKVQGSLDGIKAPSLTVKVGYDESGKPTYASTGGEISSTGVRYLAGGGDVIPFPSRGTDTVPAMLTPGERVLSVQQNQNYESNMEGPSNAEVVDSINALRSDLNTKLPRALARSLHTGLVGLRTAS
jgi:hypothetical protein